MKNRGLCAVLFCFLLHSALVLGQTANDSSVSSQDCLQHPEQPVCHQYAASLDRDAASLDRAKANPSELKPTPVTEADQGTEQPRFATRNTARTPLQPPQPPTEFQQLVQDSVGKPLPIFGEQLFLEPVSTFAPVDHAPVPADYVVGPGDELVVHVWGQVSLDLRATVDRNGQIFVPKIGEISVAGVHFSKLDTYFRDQISRFYRNFEVAVALGRLRSINVFFVGQVRRPGSYTVSSLSTLVNALFAAGGPASHGSLRHIQLKRGGQVHSEFDLYDFLLKGDKSRDAALLPGDVIYVPPVGPQVAVSGSVNSPAIYELKNAQESLSDAIAMAGGLNSVAEGTKVTIERIDEHKTLKVAEFALDETASNQQLKDGDIVRVFSIVPRFDNAVTLRGNVANPGRYPWHPGMRVRDLIPNKEMLLTRNYWGAQNQLVDGRSTEYKSSDAKRRKSLGVGSTAQDGSELESESQTEQPNAQREKSPLRALRVDQEQLRNEVKLSAPEINWDYASIQRIDPVDLSTKLKSFSIGKALLASDDENNVELQAGDVVTIFSQRDIAVPQERRTKFVRIEGEVKTPGVYRLSPGETLRALLERAGGLTKDANLFGSQLTRESAREEQQKSLDRLVGLLEAEVQAKAVSDAKEHPEEAATAAIKIESQRRVLDQLRNTRASGRVVLQVKPTDTDIAALPVLTLEDGDRVFIPATSPVVSVVGSVFNQSSFLFKQGATVGYYIRQAGSGTRTADVKHSFLVRADGSVVGRSSSAGFWSGDISGLRVLPGDTVVIPTKLEGRGFGRALRDWTQVASQLAITAASLSVINH